jgi:hypothetical protein
LTLFVVSGLPLLPTQRVSNENPIQAAMLWSNAFPEQAIRYAALVDSKNVPILFYGLCLDQDGNPLEGVRLKIGVRQWRGVSRVDLRGVELPFDRTSDKNGRFELSGVNGDVAGVDGAQKEGYIWIKQGSASVDFWGRRTIVPALDSPFVLHFWKTRGAEPLNVSKPFDFQPISCNGTSVSYDLLTGTKTVQSQNPTIQFSMVRNPESLPQQKKGKFDWEFSVTLPGGGVQWTTTNMPFYAPPSGYEPRAALSFKADDEGWQPQAKPTLYFRTAEGHYGRLTLWILADRSGPTASFEWTSYLNPSGSRVLEYDPAKRLKPPSSTPATRSPVSTPLPPGVTPAAPPATGPVVPPAPAAVRGVTNRPGPLFPPGFPPPRPPQ